jgi:hypothetical protein
LIQFIEDDPSRTGGVRQCLFGVLDRLMHLVRTPPSGSTSPSVDLDCNNLKNDDPGASITIAIAAILPLAIKTLKLLVVLARSGVERGNRDGRGGGC